MVPRFCSAPHVGFGFTGLTGHCISLHVSMFLLTLYLFALWFIFTDPPMYLCGCVCVCVCRCVCVCVCVCMCVCVIS